MRGWLLATGAASLALAWLGPLPDLVAQSFAAHMAMHVVVVGVAAPLIAAGLAGGSFDPVRKAPALFAPIPASVVELVVVWGWHAPLLHGAARTQAPALAVEQAMFLAAGLLVWLSAFGGGAAQRPARAGPGIAALLMTSMHMTLLGVLLALAPRPLFAHGADGGAALLQDQQWGGILMLLVGGAAYLAGGLVLLSGMLGEGRGRMRER